MKKQLEEVQEANRIRSTLDDETLLDSMEASFNKFHEFLELLDKPGSERHIGFHNCDELLTYMFT